MATNEFRLPDPGEGLVEADIVTWRVAVGDQVKVNDILLEVETSKSLVELPSPYAGTVSALLVAEGDTVEVGLPIITIDDGQAAAASPAGNGGAAESGERVANLVGYGPRTGDNRRRSRRPAAADPASAQTHDLAADTFGIEVPVSRRADEREPLPADHDEPSGAPLPGPGTAPAAPTAVRGAVLAKPPVRKLAKDSGVDLDSLTGSGPGGVITRDDVIAAAAPAAAPAPVPAAPAPAVPGLVAAGSAPTDTRLPIKGVRKATAEAMVRSAYTSPHVTEWLTCEVGATMALVERLKTRREFREVRISPLLVVAKAVCLALGRTPELNSFWDDPAQEIVLKGAVNLGIAAATPRGLVVPNIKNAQALDLLGLAQAINGIVTTAREGRTSPSDMAQGTFTITNVGTFGVDAGTPILNPGESGILCLGQITRRPWVVGSGDDERIEPRWATTLAVSFDHRLADGAQGSTFLADVAAILNDPGLALLY